MKSILKDILTGALPWTTLLDFLTWRLFRARLDDEITLVQEH